MDEVNTKNASTWEHLEKLKLLTLFKLEKKHLCGSYCFLFLINLVYLLVTFGLKTSVSLIVCLGPDENISSYDFFSNDVLALFEFFKIKLKRDKK